MLLKLTENTKTILFALIAVFFWSTSATAFKLSLSGMSFTMLLFVSSSVSAAVLFIIVFFNSKKELLNFFARQNLKNNIILGILNPFLYYLILFKAYSLLPAQEAQPLNFTWPIVISIFSVIFLKQKLSVRTIIGLVFAFMGVVIIATRGDLLSLEFHNLFGVILAVGSSLIWASFWILNLLDQREASVKLFGAFSFGAGFTALYILLFDSFKIVEFKYLLGGIYVGLFEMSIAFFMWTRALSLAVNKARTATLAYLAPFISLLFISLVLGEKLFLSSITGLVLIVGGIMYQQIGSKKD